MFADAGYDVWLGNARGTIPSRAFDSLNQMNPKEYWNFSWNEIGRYDLHSMIEFIRNKIKTENRESRRNKSEELIYIGYS